MELDDKEFNTNTNTTDGFTTPYKTPDLNTNTTDGFTTPSKTINRGRPASLRRNTSLRKPEKNPETLSSVSNTRKKRRIEEDLRNKRLRWSAGSKRSKKTAVSGTETSASEAIQQDPPLVEQETIITETCDTQEDNSLQKRKTEKTQMLQVEKPNGFQQGSKRNKKSAVCGTETRASEAIQQDPPLVEQVMVITETCDTQEDNSLQKRKTEKTQMLQVEKPNGFQQDNQEAGKGDSLALDKTTDLEEQPLSTWVHGRHPLSALKKRSCCSPPDQHDESSAALAVKNYQQDWPFKKRFPIWDAIESLDSFQTPVQQPHFSPLQKLNPEIREGLAIGYMVTFANLVEDMSKIQLSNPLNIIYKTFETLSDLETHGFNVGPIRARLNEFVSWKVKVCQLKDELQSVENEVEKRNMEKSTIEEEMSELAAKMVQAEIAKRVKEEELKSLKSNMDVVTKEIDNWTRAFQGGSRSHPAIK